MPTPSGQILYSLRVPYADTVILGVDSPLSMQLERDGVGVVPDEVERVQVLDRNGLVLHNDAAPGVDAEGRVTTTVPASASGFTVGELYQVRLVARVDGKATADTWRRPAVCARFYLSPPITDHDLTSGNYPDLLDELSGYGRTGANGEATLQPYIDEAWNVILRKLFKVNRWPDLLFSVEDLVEPVREEAWARVFRFLYQTTGDGARFERLWTEHRDNAKTEWETLSARWDNDADGLPDTEDRDSAQGAIHRNPAPRRRLRRRW